MGRIILSKTSTRWLLLTCDFKFIKEIKREVYSSQWQCGPMSMLIQRMFEPLMQPSWIYVIEHFKWKPSKLYFIIKSVRVRGTNQDVTAAARPWNNGIPCRSAKLNCAAQPQIRPPLLQCAVQNTNGVLTWLHSPEECLSAPIWKSVSRYSWMKNAE